MQQTVLDERYELEEKIGEGGMARVYRGRDRRLNRLVAIKILHSRYINDPDFLSRFRHEAEAAAKLSHPNVVDVYDYGQDGDTHYIVLEYVAGTDLKTIIKHEAPLPIEQALIIGAEVARGLAAAHRTGLIHRDIKPQNIIVAPDGHVRITDFGVAKSDFSTALTETGITFGTVDYISPEQARGQQATPRSDIYALGVTLYEMLTGRLPFAGENAVAVAMQHVGTAPPPPRHFNPQIPLPIEALLLRMLDKDPAVRPTNADELARTLNAYRTQAAGVTIATPHVTSPAGDPPRPPASSASLPNANVAARTSMPPPRPTPARAPRREGAGAGCGVFLIGLLILTGVLGMVWLFSTGVFDGLLLASSSSNPPAPGRPSTREPALTTTAGTATPDLTPSPTVVTETLTLVPDLLGLSEDLAERRLREADLVPIAATPRHSSFPQGVVFEQEVPAGIDVTAGSSVTYTVSLGPNLVVLPDFVGRRADRVQSEITNLGLVPELVEEPSREISAGFIIRQSPNPGLRLQAGDNVVIYVSLGDVVRFPDVIGMSRERAEEIINNTAGLSVNYVDEQGPDRLANFERYFPGEVVSASYIDGRSIRNGDYLPRGTAVVLGVRRAT